MARFRDGHQIGVFRILKLLNSGGFGEAYLAQDTDLERFVVIKCIREDLHVQVDDEDLFQECVERFWIEARAQASLNHPNVCTIHQHDPVHQMIVMEYVDGENLEDRRLRGPLSREDIMEIVTTVAQTVAVLHDTNILHRDLTLRNLMVRDGVNIKILDFGLAKMLDEPPFTEFAGAIGTPRYMSPEQERSPREVTVRSDVFSFGVAIYRLVTGTYPYMKSFRDEPKQDFHREKRR